MGKRIKRLRSRLQMANRQNAVLRSKCGVKAIVESFVGSLHVDLGEGQSIDVPQGVISINATKRDKRIGLSVEMRAINGSRNVEVDVTCPIVP